MKSLLLLTATLRAAVAMPSYMGDADALKLAHALLERQDPLGISKSQTNCGPTPCLTFDEKDQAVNIGGEHVYAAPGLGDIRGPCPGLNAAANHGFLPRNG